MGRRDSSATEEPRRGAPVDVEILFLVVVTALFHVLSAPGYGIFRDELYYLACGERLDWGYVDHPPLVAIGAWLIRHTFGTSLVALRLFPALAAGFLVFLGAAMARQLGGGRFAAALTGLVVALTPIYLALFSTYSMNALDLVAWSVLLLLVLRTQASGNGRLWLWFGLAAGVGLQNKLSVAFLCLGLIAALVLCREWRHLRDRRLWLGVGIAALVFAPHLLWQIANGWPTLEFIQNATEAKNIAYEPLAFVSEQVFIMNPVTAPLWLLGLVALLVTKRFRRFRVLGVTYLAVLLLLLVRAAKPYYLAPVYPVLFAAGAVVLERATGRRAWTWTRVVAIVAILVSGSFLAPVAKPLLPVDRYVSYSESLGLTPGSDERHEMGRLPQFFADMHGWRALAEAVHGVLESLPEEDRGRACVFAQNYGQAGAIEFFGAELGLPPVVCGHNSYWLWGPGDCTGDVVIVVGGDRDVHLQSFHEVSEGARFQCRNCMPYEANKTLWVARGLRRPIEEAWPAVKHFQ